MPVVQLVADVVVGIGGRSRLVPLVRDERDPESVGHDRVDAAGDGQGGPVDAVEPQVAIAVNPVPGTVRGDVCQQVDGKRIQHGALEKIRIISHTLDQMQTEETKKKKQTRTGYSSLKFLEFSTMRKSPSHVRSPAPAKATSREVSKACMTPKVWEDSKFGVQMTPQ